MKTISLLICFVLVFASIALAQKTITVWNNGQATIYQISPNGQVTGITPGSPGMIYGNLNDGNLYDNRPSQHSQSLVSPNMGANPLQSAIDNIYKGLPQ